MVVWGLGFRIAKVLSSDKCPSEQSSNVQEFTIQGLGCGNLNLHP